MQKHKSISRILCSSFRHFSYFNHNAAGFSEFDYFSNELTSQQRILADPKSIDTLLSKCLNLKQLGQVFAHIIQTRFLEVYPLSSHYNSISQIYSRLDSPREALCVYAAMHHAGISPDDSTFPIVLEAAIQYSDVVISRQVHGVAIKHGLDKDMDCESGLISVYLKEGEIYEMAQKAFLSSPEKMLASWNAVIAGLLDGGRAIEAVQMFVGMMRNGVCPDDETMVCVASACGDLGDYRLALQLHDCVVRAKRLGRLDIGMMNSLIDMYGKCGRMGLAYKVFCEIEEKNESSWASMIAGYAANRQVDDALECFGCMRREDIAPKHDTFVGVLTACVHGGVVQEGKYYFNMMKNDYGIKPMLPHYGCMVDLLGRAGLLEEAWLMVEKMPMKADAVILDCLMGACETYGNVKLGEWVTKQMTELELEPEKDDEFLDTYFANFDDILSL
ncbi:hypothetical protein C2S51_036404 [Perilla frutescens var. frutescens]|nr:hypothetical protein C2S51_036404 [Perilla frutescens var. frutescens]